MTAAAETVATTPSYSETPRQYSDLSTGTVAGGFPCQWQEADLIGAYLAHSRPLPRIVCYLDVFDIHGGRHDSLDAGCWQFV